jgi:hypothetical protein
VGLGDHAPLAALERERHQAVVRLGRSGLLLHRHDEAAVRREREVAVAGAGPRAREGARRAAGEEGAAVGVGADHEAALHAVVPAAVLVDARADVAARRQLLGGAARERRPHHRLAAALRRPPLEPVDVAAVQPGQREPQRRRRGVPGGDRRGPGAEGLLLR